MGRPARRARRVTVITVRLRLAAAAVTIMAVSITGCSAPVASSDTTPRPSDSSTSDSASRGAAFLAAACPALIADEEFNAVWSDQSSPLEPIVERAAAARDAGSDVATALDEFSTQWPEYSNDLLIAREMYLGKVEDYAFIAEATALDQLVPVVFADVTAGNDAFVRLQTALDVTLRDC